VLVLTSVILLVQCTRERTQPLKIGYIGSLTGKYSALGTNARDGAILAIEEYNARGGIDGRPVQLIIEDDLGDPNQAPGIVKGMADQGIRFLLGPFITGSGTKILSLINDKGILTISGTIMGDNLENLDDYFIKLNPSTRTFGRKLAEFLIGKGFKNPGFIADSRNDPYCSTFLGGYRSAIENSLGTTLLPVEFEGGSEVQYSQLAAHVVEGGADAVLVCASALDTALLSQHMKRISPGIFLTSSPWGISVELIRNGGNAVEGLHFYMSIQYGELSQAARDFEDKFKARFNQEASFAAIFNYEAAVMLLDGLVEGSTDEPLKVKQAILAKETQRGVQLDFRLDSEGDPVRPLFLHKIENGQFRMVEDL
jgi:branched-chain amino acid transport system substrate-binding protein